MVYIVTWDFNKEKPNYNTKRAKFLLALKSHIVAKDPGLDSVLFISYSGSSTQLYNSLVKCFDANDRLVVAKLTARQATALLTARTLNWINARL